MQHRSILYCVVLAACFVGCLSSSEKYTTSIPIDGSAAWNSTGGIRSFGGVFGWEIKWDVVTSDFIQIGPYIWTDKNNTIINGPFTREIKREQNGDPVHSKSSARYLLDPCVSIPVPEDNFYYYSLSIQSNATNGFVNVTEYIESLTTFGHYEYGKSFFTINCYAGCQKYVLFNTTTNLNSFTTVLNITSPVKTFLTYTYGPNNCPSNNGSNVYNVHIDADAPTIIRVYNQTEIWLLLSEYTLNYPQVVNIEWNVVPGNSPGNNPSNGPQLHNGDSSVVWGLIGGAVGIVLLVAIIVVIVVVRKKRAGYAKIQ